MARSLWLADPHDRRHRPAHPGRAPRGTARRPPCRRLPPHHAATSTRRVEYTSANPFRPKNAVRRASRRGPLRAAPARGHCGNPLELVNRTASTGLARSRAAPSRQGLPRSRRPCRRTRSRRARTASGSRPRAGRFRRRLASRVPGPRPGRWTAARVGRPREATAARRAPPGNGPCHDSAHDDAGSRRRAAIPQPIDRDGHRERALPGPRPGRDRRRRRPRAARGGDVLVAPFTGPAYNSILPILGALVVENGGSMCHAAIVAREFGLPAVIGASGATTAIPDGALVEVDPLRGIVSVVA
ncbi:MAG: hypothetical protein DLM70_12580 [Chloroflexi bacterium]|nr:MAG: hypothetical protein DLM70_12580 [Chloroflexota bacterium]